MTLGDQADDLPRWRMERPKGSNPPPGHDRLKDKAGHGDMVEALCFRTRQDGRWTRGPAVRTPVAERLVAMINWSPKRGCKMRKRTLLAVVLAVLMAASVHAQTTCFFDLAKTGAPQSVQAAISNGADVNAKDEDPAGRGRTALMYAAEFNPDPQVITTLLTAGADLNAQENNGATALLFAAGENPNPEVVTTLLAAGADLSTKSHYGMTVLMYAAKVTKNPEVITILLKAGADAKAKDHDGNTALSYSDINDNLAGTDALKQLQEASK